MTSTTIDLNTYWNFTLDSNPIKSIEKIIIDGDFSSVCVSKIFSKLNSSDLKTIIINGKITKGQICLKKFVNLEYLEFGEKFEISYEIDFSSNPKLNFLKIFSCNFNQSLVLCYNVKLKSLEFGDFCVFNYPLDLSCNVNLESLKLPSNYNHELFLANCPIKKLIIDKNCQSIIDIKHENLDELIIIGVGSIIPNELFSNKHYLDKLKQEKSSHIYSFLKTHKERIQYVDTFKQKFPYYSCSVCYGKRLNNIKKHIDEDNLDKIVHYLTEEEFNKFVK